MSQEFSTLFDLAVSQGANASDLLSRVRDKIESEYKTAYPKAPQGSQIIIDPGTGTMRVIFDGQDVTPKGFEAKATTLAHQVIVDYLKTSPAPNPPVATSQASKPNIPSLHLPDRIVGRFLVQLIFWGYNFIFILMGTSYLFGYFETIFESLSGGYFDPFAGLLALAILGIPLTAIVHATKNKLYRQPRVLAKLFFIFELPLLLITYTFTNVSPGSTSPLWFFYITLMLVPPILYQAITPDDTKGVNPYLAYTLAFFALLSAGYFLLLYSFMVPGLLGHTVQFLFDDFFDQFNRYNRATADLFTFIAASFTLILKAALSIVVLAGIFLPYLLVYLLYRQYQSNLDHLRQSVGYLQFRNTLLVTSVVYLAFFSLTLLKPSSTDYLSQLAAYAKATTYEEKAAIARELTPHKSEIEALLQNASNRHRGVFGISPDSNMIAELLEEGLGLPDAIADGINAVFLVVAKPLVVPDTGSTYAARNAFNDIFSSTAPTISANVEATYRQVSANLDDTGRFATVIIEEAYTNRTNQQQEVIYEFSLPAGSAVTDLYLGPELEYRGIIAPRGAAQRTYEQQIQTRRDPALLEQTGPQQYRLRVFPIPAKSDRATLQGRDQKVSFTYVTPVDNQGIGLPAYTLSSNVKIADTVISTKIGENLVKVTPDSTHLKHPFDNIACEFLPSTLNLSDGTTFTYQGLNQGTLHDLFTCNPETGTYKLANVQDLKIALMYDTSTAATDQVFNRFAQDLRSSPEFMRDNQLDLIFFNRYLAKPVTIRTEADLNALSLSFFTVGDLNQHLKNLTHTDYDAVIIYTPSVDNLNQLSTSFASPVYLVHTKPPAYSQALTVDLLTSGGTTTTTITDAINHLVATRTLKGTSQNLLTVLPLAYSTAVYPAAATTTTSKIDPRLEYYQDTPIASASAFLGPLTAKSLSDRLIIDNAPLTTNTAFLDSLQVFADTNRHVTPFSSLLSLVNELQLRQLETQIKSSSRYTETPARTQPPTPITRPVPDPMPPTDTFDLPMRGQSLPGIGMSNLFGVNNNAIESFAPVTGGSDMMMDSKGEWLTGAPAQSFNILGSSSLLLISSLFLFIVGGGYLILSHLKHH